MPYRQKHRFRISRRRSRAVTSIARAWRNRRRRRKGGLVARTAVSNRRQIKRIKGDIEVKYMTRMVATPESNYCGQLLTTSVDCTGCPNKLTMWAPTTPPGLSAAFIWQPIAVRPICLPQGDNEGNRLGEYINMKWICMKGTVSAYPAKYNATNPTTNIGYAGLPSKQTVRFIVTLDTNPNMPATYNPGTATSYDPALSPGSVYGFHGAPAAWGVDPFAAIAAAGNVAPGAVLRSGSRMPLGVSLADGMYDPYAQSFWENDFVQSKKYKDKRFKVLKVFSVTVQQDPQQGGSNTTTHKNFSHTLKLPYKFQFPQSTAMCPINKDIVIFIVSNVRPCITGETTSCIQTPRVSLSCKVAYTDP